MIVKHNLHPSAGEKLRDAVNSAVAAKQSGGPRDFDEAVEAFQRAGGSGTTLRTLSQDRADRDAMVKALIAVAQKLPS